MTKMRGAEEGKMNDEKMVSIETVRRAVESADETWGKVGGGHGNFVDLVLARLVPPERKLRDEVPVMYDDADGKSGFLSLAQYIFPNVGFVNVSPLILVDKAREIAKRAIITQHAANRVSTDKAMAEVDRDLDEYMYGAQEDS